MLTRVGKGLSNLPSGQQLADTCPSLSRSARSGISELHSLITNFKIGTEEDSGL